MSHDYGYSSKPTHIHVHVPHNNDFILFQFAYLSGIKTSKTHKLHHLNFVLGFPSKIFRCNKKIVSQCNTLKLETTLLGETLINKWCIRMLGFFATEMDICSRARPKSAIHKKASFTFGRGMREHANAPIIQQQPLVTRDPTLVCQREMFVQNDPLLSQFSEGGGGVSLHNLACKLAQRCVNPKP